MNEQNINDRLDTCLMESVNPETIATAIMSEFTVCELEKVICKLIDVYAKAPKLLHEFWQRSSDACPLEAIEAESQEKEWFKWIHKSIRGDRKAVAE